MRSDIPSCSGVLGLWRTWKNISAVHYAVWPSAAPLEINNHAAVFTCTEHFNIGTVLNLTPFLLFSSTQAHLFKESCPRNRNNRSKSHSQVWWCIIHSACTSVMTQKSTLHPHITMPCFKLNWCIYRNVCAQFLYINSE